MTPFELYEKMLLVIDREGMRLVEKTHGSAGWLKFYDVEEYSRRAANKAFQLGLDRGGLRVLDVGGGLGYVALAAELLGNHAICLEVPHETIEAVSRCVPVNFYRWRIRQFEPLPRFAKPFDLILITGANLTTTGVNTTHNAEVKGNEWWDAAKYQFLFTDLLGQLVPGGMLRVERNRGQELDFMATHEWNEPHETRDNVITFVKG